MGLPAVIDFWRRARVRPLTIYISNNAHGNGKFIYYRSRRVKREFKKLSIERNNKHDKIADLEKLERNTRKIWQFMNDLGIEINGR